MAAPRLLRTINETRVLNLLLERGPRSRAAIARDLQVTRSTASALVASLVARGLVLETEETATEERIGRPGFVVKLNRASQTYIGVDIAVSEMRIVALDMQADLIGSVIIPYTDPATPDYVVGLMKPGVEKLLADHDLDMEAVEALGVAIPGLVENDGLIVFAPNLNWRNIDIKSMIEAAFDRPSDRALPLHFDNDANACALSEGYDLPGRNGGTLAFFLMEIGMGLGLLHDGQVFRGFEGVAGEMGHARFFNHLGDEEDSASTPTFEETVGREAVLRLCQKGGVDAKSVSEVVALAKGGDAGAMSVFEVWAKRLAIGVANLAAIVNPQEIVLGGKTSAMFTIDPKRVHDEVNRHLRFMFKTPTIRTSSRGVLAASFGVGYAVHRQRFGLTDAADLSLTA